MLESEREMKAAAAADEGCGAPIWSATTNWIPAAGGCLADVVFYDTSDDPEIEQSPKPLVLLKPEGDDSPPCEVTISFRERHEIHRVYVRSTARVYEIYYSPDHQDSSEEYLCTVRCGGVAREMMPGSVDIEVANGFQVDNEGTAANKGLVVRSDSNTSDEDGWVQIKAPDSSLLDDKEDSVAKKCDIGMDSPMTLEIHYEATADITDYACVSLTLRLLSIQTKACIHIEEIYVFADPVEPSHSGTPVSMGDNTGRSSLLAMLVPSLMQLSKSNIGQDKYFSKEAKVSEYQNSSDKVAQTVSSGIGNTVAQEACSGKLPDEERKLDQERAAIKHEVTAPNQIPTSHADQNNSHVYNRLEKTLDELVLKVGRIETFCSKFEENMLKPLSCMEQRLQELELKLDALAVKTQTPDQCLCSRDFSLKSNENDLMNKHGNTNHTESSEDTGCVATTLTADEVETSGPGFQTRPGLVIQAPEFLNEDDDCSNKEDTLNPLKEDIPIQKTPLTLESALASSLSAFLTSTTIKSPNPTPITTGISHEFKSDNINNTSVDSSAEFLTEGAGNLSDNSVLEDSGRDFLHGARRGCVGDLSLSSLDSAAVSEELLPDTEKNLTASDFVPEVPAFSDTPSRANADVLPPTFSSQPHAGFIVMAPEFLNSSGSFNGDDTVDSPDLDSLENETSLPSVSEKVSPLSEYQSSDVIDSSKNILDSSKSVPQLFSAASGLPSIDSHEVLTSIVADPSEGAKETRIENQEENEMKAQVSVDPLLRMLHFEDGFEQKHHDGVECKDWDSVEKGDGIYTHPSQEQALLGLNTWFGQNYHSDGSDDCDDAKEAILLGFDHHGKGWIEDSNSTSSSLHETLIKQTVLETEWHAASSGNEGNPAFALKKSIGLADINPVTCHSSVDKLEDILCDAKLTSERTLTSVCPLELLLREMRGAEPSEPSTSYGDGNHDSDGDDVSSNEARVQEGNVCPLELLLCEMLGAEPTEPSTSDGDGNHNSDGDYTSSNEVRVQEGNLVGTSLSYVPSSLPDVSIAR